jgi:hypothetical protein
MPNYRVPKDYFFATLTNSAAITDTSLVSADFAPLLTNYGTDWVLPLTLHDPVLKVYEVVWVTGHTVASTTVTVLRGKEGTTARAWPAGTQIICAPTLRDGLVPMTRASLPADRHTGQRVALSDEGLTVQSTMDQGWLADVGVANPLDVGLRLSGGAIPAWKAITMREGRASGTTDANGRFSATFHTPFPTETLEVMTNLLASSNGGVVVTRDGALLPTAGGYTVYCYLPSTGVAAPAGVNVTVGYIAIGY